MTYLSRSLVLFVVVAVITALVPILGCPSPGQGQNNLADRVAALEADLAIANAKLAHVSVQEGTINGLTGPHLIIEGCNLHVRSGSGDTEDSGGLTGLGNLIVGYNEEPQNVVHGRLGSHNLLVGSRHEYSSFGGFIAGRNNAVTEEFASVSGGIANTASGNFSSVSGGESNTASGSFSSVSGGSENAASDFFSSVSGGRLNLADGFFSSVSGGNGRSAVGTDDWVAGSLFEDN